MKEKQEQYIINKSIKRKIARQKAQEQQEWICLIAFALFWASLVYLYFRG